MGLPAKTDDREVDELRGRLAALRLRDKPVCWKVCSPQGFVFACWRTRFGVRSAHCPTRKRPRLSARSTRP